MSAAKSSTVILASSALAGVGVKAAIIPAAGALNNPLAAVDKGPVIARAIGVPEDLKDPYFPGFIIS